MKLFLVIAGALLVVTVSTKEECDRSPINTHELDSSPEIKKKVKELGIEVGNGASMEIFAVFDVRKKITEYVKMQNKDGPVRYYQLRKASQDENSKTKVTEITNEVYEHWKTACPDASANKHRAKPSHSEEF
ncbi:unnamed protein product [Nippostrongylus brasiliensis]|uniref:Cystatin domain-containing protein n=1 Tax=Nippostrongylus brasiliensis TaxID=27835 RepID=A0A0N4YNI9_NIPBR|nr:unnamed protein product [Nippostrongylus brasiliensis]